MKALRKLTLIPLSSGSYLHNIYRTSTPFALPRNRFVNLYAHKLLEGLLTAEVFDFPLAILFPINLHCKKGVKSEKQN